MYEVTLARESDFQRIINISSQCYRPFLSIRDVRRHYNRLGPIYVVRGGIFRQAYGYAMIASQPDALAVLDVAVAADVRYKGLGRLLIDHMQFIASAEGLSRVRAYVGDDNLPGQVFLRKCGYWCIAIKGQCYAFEIDLKKPRSAALMPVNRIRKVVA